MSDEEARQRLAEVLVEALEIGGGKNEHDVIDDLFAAFGVDFAGLERSYPRQVPDRKAVLRAAAASKLAQAAPSAVSLLNEVTRCGGRFVSMVEEVYQRLSRHAATTSGTNETIRLQRSGVDEQQLTISPAFIERVRHLVKRLARIEVGRIDQGALISFIGWDNGELYGRWPLGADGGERLADDLLHLKWLIPALTDRAVSSLAWDEVVTTGEVAAQVAEQLIAAARRLINAHLAHLDMLDRDDGIEDQLFVEESPSRLADRVASEIDRYRNTGMLGAVAVPGFVHGIAERSCIGLNRQLERMQIPMRDLVDGTGISLLAGFIGQWDGGNWASSGREPLEAEVFTSPETLVVWLRRLISNCCREATAWLSTDVLRPTATVDPNELVDSLEDFLNMPLWKQRHLLYEVWVLCATIEVCEQGGWTAELAGAEDPLGVWVLSVQPTEEPVGRLRLRDRPTVVLDVWREPRRVTTGGELTPDVTIATPPPYRRDLVVVEAKDRIRMPVGQRSPDGRGGDHRTALAVAERYAIGLNPAVTWVVNHCDYRYESDPTVEHGTVWSRIRLAAQFRPRNVPSAFAETVLPAITPPNEQAADIAPTARGLLLVIDWSGSMADSRDQAFSMLLSGGLDERFDQFRAVVYADHGPGEPFLVRTMGPALNFADLITAIEMLPAAHGGDLEEALEDALQRCRELVSSIGPQTILVLTDAPAHRAAQCPYGVDVRAETRALLELGCRLSVVEDWLETADSTWEAVADIEGFERTTLATFLEARRSAS